MHIQTGEAFRLVQSISHNSLEMYILVLRTNVSEHKKPSQGKYESTVIKPASLCGRFQHRNILSNITSVCIMSSTTRSRLPIARLPLQHYTIKLPVV
jgi:hypothetical protein